MAFKPQEHPSGSLAVDQGTNRRPAVWVWHPNFRELCPPNLCEVPVKISGFTDCVQVLTEIRNSMSRDSALSA